jgi:hypothetical protein
MDPERFLQILTEQKWLGMEEAERLLQEYDDQPGDFFGFLEASGLGSKEELLRAVAEAHGTDYVDLGQSEFPPQLFNSVPADLVRIYRCVPIHDSSEVLKVCLVDPLDDVAVNELRNLLGRPIEVVLADPDAVEALVQERLLTGSLFPSVPGRTAPVVASLGVKPDTQPDVLEQGRGSGIRMVGLAFLSASAAAAAALYLGQQYSAQAAKTLLGEFESYQETHRLSRLTWEQDVRDLEMEIHKLRTLLERSEVDAIKLGQLEVGMQRLEGKFEGLSAIKPSSTSVDGPPEVND